MNAWSKQIVPQPLTGLIALALGIGVLVMAWRTDQMLAHADANMLLEVGFLFGACILGARFPIQLHNNTKLLILTLPLYLIAVLVPPALAALTIACAMFGASLVLFPTTRNHASDIATTVGRWTVVGWLGSTIAHSASPDSTLQLAAFMAAAVVMFAGDMIGTAFEVSAMSGESPIRLIPVLVREMGFAESVQYLLGIAGVLAAQHQPIALPLFALPAVIVYLAFKRAKEMQEGTRTLLEGMADAIDLRDPYTGGHSRRVMEMCREVLDSLGMRGPNAQLILAAARVHDIGKIGISDELLRKPGKLTPEERKLMETHVEVGANLLARYSDFKRGKEIVRHHHERWDGKGYPAGLKGTEIPLGARIVAVADSFDAMTSDRPYRKALSNEQALFILADGRGTQWDPRIIDIFLALHGAPQIESQPLIPLESASQSLRVTV